MRVKKHNQKKIEKNAYLCILTLTNSDFIMRRVISVIFLIVFILVGGLFAQNVDNNSCSLGFTFEISNDKSWGFSEPVIVHIIPGSPAEKAGLKLNDIILSVNENGTYLKSSQTIMSWFNQDPHTMHLAIRNFKHEIGRAHV